MIVSQAVHNSIEYQKANSKANPDANGAVSSVLHPEIETVHRLYRPFQHTGELDAPQAISVLSPVMRARTVPIYRFQKGTASSSVPVRSEVYAL